MTTQAAASFDHLILGLAEWVLVGCAGWACLILVTATIEAATRGRVVATRWVATPPAVRRALLACLGVALVGAAPGPGAAAMTDGPSPRPAPSPALGASLAVPARPVGAAPARAVVVRRGDTLWALATAALPARTSSAGLVSATQRWYASNRATIGPDPDLIRPGQRLHPPAGAGRSSEPRR